MAFRETRSARPERSSRGSRVAHRPEDRCRSAIDRAILENLREFFERFRRLNIRSNSELDMLVEEAEQVITGIEPQQLRESNRLRQMVANDFEQIQASVGELLVDRPRRNILRRPHASGGAV